VINEPLQWILGTTTKVQIVRALVPLRTAVTGREVLRLARIRSSAGAATALNQLTALGILLRTGTPTTHQYQINPEHDMAGPLRALFDAESERTERVVEFLADALSACGLRHAVQSAVLFGSYARRDARPESDLDVLFVVSDPSRVAAVEDAMVGAAPALETRMGLRLSPLVIGAERAVERWKDGDPLMKSIRDEGRTLLGEPFGEVLGAW